VTPPKAATPQPVKKMPTPKPSNDWVTVGGGIKSDDNQMAPSVAQLFQNAPTPVKSPEDLAKEAAKKEEAARKKSEKAKVAKIKADKAAEAKAIEDAKAAAAKAIADEVARRKAMPFWDIGQDITKNAFANAIQQTRVDLKKSGVPYTANDLVSTKQIGEMIALQAVALAVETARDGFKKAGVRDLVRQSAGPRHEAKTRPMDTFSGERGFYKESRPIYWLKNPGNPKSAPSTPTIAARTGGRRPSL